MKLIPLLTLFFLSFASNDYVPSTDELLKENSINGAEENLVHIGYYETTYMLEGEEVEGLNYLDDLSIDVGDEESNIAQETLSGGPIGPPGSAPPLLNIEGQESFMGEKPHGPPGSAPVIGIEHAEEEEEDDFSGIENGPETSPNNGPKAEQEEEEENEFSGIENSPETSPGGDGPENEISGIENGPETSPNNGPGIEEMRGPPGPPGTAPVAGIEGIRPVDSEGEIIAQQNEIDDDLNEVFSLENTQNENDSSISSWMQSNNAYFYASGSILLLAGISGIAYGLIPQKDVNVYEIIPDPDKPDHISRYV